MDVEEVVTRGAIIDDCYRRGFERAQDVSAQFYLEQAFIYGWQTPLAHELTGLSPIEGRAIDDLQRDEIARGLDDPTFELLAICAAPPVPGHQLVR